MFTLRQASEPAPRYQTTRGARYTVRPLTLLQWFLLTRCDGSVTLADLAQATRRPAEEVSHALNFLRAHGLVHIIAGAARARYTP